MAEDEKGRKPRASRRTRCFRWLGTPTARGVPRGRAEGSPPVHALGAAPRAPSRRIRRAPRQARRRRPSDDPNTNEAERRDACRAELDLLMRAVASRGPARDVDNVDKRMPRPECGRGAGAPRPGGAAWARAVPAGAHGALGGERPPVRRARAPARARSARLPQRRTAWRAGPTWTR